MGQVVYVSPLMKGWQVREACRAFREQEATVRRQTFVVKGGNSSVKH